MQWVGTREVNSIADCFSPCWLDEAKGVDTVGVLIVGNTLLALTFG